MFKIEGDKAFFGHLTTIWRGACAMEPKLGCAQMSPQIVTKWANIPSLNIYFIFFAFQLFIKIPSLPLQSCISLYFHNNSFRKDPKLKFYIIHNIYHGAHKWIHQNSLACGASYPNLWLINTPHINPCEFSLAQTWHSFKFCTPSI